MSTDKKVLRKRRAKKGSQEEEEKLTKDETEVAKFLRWNLKTKKSSMFGDEVFYFTGSKIVDLMLDSKWATGKAKKSTIEFTDRDSTYFILDKMIALGLFSRVHRIYKEKEKKNKDKKDDKKKNKEDNGEDNGKEVKDSPRSKRKEKGKDETAKEEKDPKEGKKKKKVKVSLEPHEHNIFLDSDDAVFIWIYDPVHPKTFFLGILLVIGAVAVCLFPLWPESFRVYSWYLSVAAMIFVGVILFLAIFRYILFCLLWGLTIGKLKFWLLPNLTADCGFFESFVPVYEYTLESGKDEKGKQTEEEEMNDDDDADIKENEEEGNDIEQEEKEKQEDEEKITTASKDKDTDVKKEENEEIAQNSGSNKETDDGEPWVKVSRSDAENGKSEKTEC